MACYNFFGTEVVFIDFAEDLSNLEMGDSDDDDSNVLKSHEEDEQKEMEKDEETGAEYEGSSSGIENVDSSIDTDTTDLGISDIETQPLIPTLEELAYSDYIHNRQLASKKILEFLQEAETREELQSILEIMCKLSDDEEVLVRSELMEHIPSIALFCKHHVTDLGVVIRQQLVPYTVKLLSDNQIQVRKVGHSSLVVLLENNLIDQAQLSEWICPLIAQLAVIENNAEDLKAEDVSVMCKMMPLVGKEIVLKFFLEPFILLCCDPSLTIRKICAASCGTLSKVIGTEQTESTLLPAFYNLCDDELWSVRKPCADVIVDIGTVVTPKKRKQELSLIYLSLLNDNSPKVRNAAYQSLGGFIATFAGPTVSSMKFENGRWIKTEISESCYVDLDSADIAVLNVSHSDEKCESICKDNNCIENVYSSYEIKSASVFNSSDVDINCLNESSGSNELNTASTFDTEFRTRLYSQEFERPKKNLGVKSELVLSLSDRNIVSYVTDSLSEVSDPLQSIFTCNLEKSTEILPHMRNSAVTEENLLNVSNKVQKSVFSWQKKSFPSIAMQTKDGHLCFHIDNDNLFNDFQFWKIPFPEVGLDTDFEEGNAAQINVKTKVHHEESSKLCATELNVQMNPGAVSVSSEISSIIEPKLPKLQVQTSASITNAVSDDDENFCNAEERIIIPSVEFESDEAVKRSNLLGENLSIIKSTWKNRKLLESPYHQDIVPPEILGKFINLHFEDYSEHTEDERTLHCAFNFPAVAYTLGKKYWPVLKRLCYILAHDVKWTVRRTLASSLHELADILGHDIVVEDLLPIFFSLLKDIDEVRLKVVLCLPEFLKHLDSQERRQFLPAFDEFLKVDNDRNWRFRHTVAEQLISTVEMFGSSDIYDYFLPIASSLIEDKVSDVRKAAVELIAVIMKSLSQDEETANYPMQLLAEYDIKYRQAHKWLMRQMYVLLCEQLAVKKSLLADKYVDDIIPKLLSLACDNVPNVRLAVSRCIAQTLVPLDYLPSIQKSHYQLLLQVMYSLQSDVDKDVRYYAYLSAASFNVVPHKKLSPV